MNSYIVIYDRCHHFPPKLNIIKGKNPIEALQLALVRNFAKIPSSGARKSDIILQKVEFENDGCLVTPERVFNLCYIEVGP